MNGTSASRETRLQGGSCFIQGHVKKGVVQGNYALKRNRTA
jgi:hypothetical protein